MRKVIGLILVAGLAGVPVWAQKITIDYANDFDFRTVKTFLYVDSKDSNSPNQLVDGRIRQAIIRALTQDGLQQVESDADISVTYHVITKENTVLNTTGYGYGRAGRGWRRWGGGMISTTTTARTYTEGTLIIDGYEPEANNLVWRGTGTVTLKADPQKQAKQVDKILKKMGKRWDKILAGKGK